ncbi:MAG: MurR/RpiR family transcriptional regulator [Anaerolineae bacterium]|nr:MurR/RpiR family transcriptional regulator [Anaerolineae bacterium]
MFRERIKNAYESLTPSFKRLAEFILDRELDVAFMTATELARALDVDAATVVRFSQALGYTGYRELSHEVQDIVKGDLTAAYGNFADAQTPQAQMQTILENERHNLEVAVAQVTERAVEIVDMIAAAERVWVIGDAMGRYLAQMFAGYLEIAGVRAFALDADPAAAAQIAGQYKAGDVAIGIGATGTGLDTAAILRYLKNKGMNVVAVTISSVSPPAQVVDRVLVCPSDTPVGMPSVASLVSMLMAIWQTVLARKEGLDAHIAAQQEAYNELMVIRAEERERLDLEKPWQEF